MKRRITAMLFFALACAAGQVATIHGQALNDVRRLFDSGQYQQVIAAGAEDPRVTFLRAQSFEKLLAVERGASGVCAARCASGIRRLAGCRPVGARAGVERRRRRPRGVEPGRRSRRSPA